MNKLNLGNPYKKANISIINAWDPSMREFQQVPGKGSHSNNINEWVSGFIINDLVQERYENVAGIYNLLLLDSEVIVHREDGSLASFAGVIVHYPDAGQEFFEYFISQEEAQDAWNKYLINGFNRDDIEEVTIEELEAKKAQVNQDIVNKLENVRKTFNQSDYDIIFELEKIYQNDPLFKKEALMYILQNYGQVDYEINSLFDEAFNTLDDKAKLEVLTKLLDQNKLNSQIDLFITNLQEEIGM